MMHASNLIWFIQIGIYRRLTFKLPFSFKYCQEEMEGGRSVVVKHSCQDRKARFLYRRHPAPYSPSCHKWPTGCHRMVSLKREEEKDKLPESLAAFAKAMFLWRKEFTELLPSRSSPSLCWCMGYSSTGTGPRICIGWISEFYALPISPACQGPSEWQHNTLHWTVHSHFQGRSII